MAHIIGIKMLICYPTLFSKQQQHEKHVFHTFMPNHKQTCMKTSQCDDENKHTEQKKRKYTNQKKQKSIFKFSHRTHTLTSPFYFITHTHRNTLNTHSHDYDVVYYCCCSYHMLSFSPHMLYVLFFFITQFLFTHPSNRQIAFLYFLYKYYETKKLEI